MDMNEMLKQAQKLQQDMENAQNALETAEIEVSSAGGAVKCKITGATKFTSFDVSEELMKEGPEAVGAAVLAAAQEAVDKSKAKHEEAMRSITSGLELPGMDDLGGLEGMGGPGGLPSDSGPRPRATGGGEGISV